ncbi:hypothetical protein PAHAL_7G240500 [Panicum hallii]|uniref:Uncharacterized protein n=1 Tax=Panicum hallii TaxID=206008 RepID=A0A2S3I8Z9_9POAL|nr:uncharacterized protein LOC112901207 [Panicum hallii]PAN39410.1 hypothetical protein PAHAL_7G240500 [Panicum hallii]
MAAAAPVLVHVESMQTAVPARDAGSGRSLPIAVSGPPLAAAELQRHFRAVLYYRGAGAGGELEATARERAAWVKESLSAALVDHPEMAGRLGRGGGDGCLWEVKLRDTGVRLVQASVEATMAAFLEARGADRERQEAALALWTDVDAHEPDICAPFFVQLTRFQDGGYAVGASCSLLLADPLSLVRFLKSWARKLAELQAQGELVANPVIQYTRYIRSTGAAAKHVKSVPLDTATATDNNTTTVLFRAAAAGTPDHRALAAACVATASERLGARAPPRFTVVARDGSEGLKVQTCAADGDQKPCPAPRAALWRDEPGLGLGLQDLALEGRKPVHVSYCVMPCADEGLVVVMPAGGGELLISATVPNYM